MTYHITSSNPVALRSLKCAIGLREATCSLRGYIAQIEPNYLRLEGKQGIYTLVFPLIKTTLPGEA